MQELHSAQCVVANDCSDLTSLVVGKLQPEFREAIGLLARVSRMTLAATVDEAAARLLAGSATPVLVVFVQSRPGEFSETAIARFRGLAPLARTVMLLGNWCEGETRTGHPLPGATRVYWYDWAPRFTQMLSAMQSGQCSAWSLPPTATEEETLLAESPPSSSAARGLVVLVTRRHATAEALAGACEPQGYATTWLRPGMNLQIRGAAAAIWEGGQMEWAEANELQQVVNDLPGVPTLALLDFPRPANRERAIAAGAIAVLAKPFLLADLYWQLDRMIRDRA